MQTCLLLFAVMIRIGVSELPKRSSSARFKYGLSPNPPVKTMLCIEDVSLSTQRAHSHTHADPSVLLKALFNGFDHFIHRRSKEGVGIDS